MRPTTALAATMALSGLVAALSPAIAAPSGYMFTTIDVPGSIPGSTDAAIGEGGINDLGEIVGNFADSTGVHGFLYNGGKFTTINPPGSTFTVLSGINNRGQILGSSSSVPSPEGNFLYEHGVFTPLNVPAFLFGLNDRGQIVGQICDNTGCHGLLDTRGSIATLDVPGSTNTGATAINNPGQIVGTYQDTTGLFHSFLDTRGVFTNFDVPGSGFTLAFGINDPGQIVGARTRRR